jgi:hypothetical protein
VPKDRERRRKEKRRKSNLKEQAILRGKTKKGK